MNTPRPRIKRAPVVLAAAMAIGIDAAPVHADPVSAHPQTVEIYSAGSLRGVVGELAKAAAADFGIEIKATFGGSGTLRERIEKGEKPDLLLSADLGSPRKLEAQGLTAVPAITFARNRMCIVSRPAAQVTPSNLVDRMLAKETRVKTSTPVVDPSGDYAWAIFDRIDALHPGAGATLKAKARMTTAASAGSSTGALFASGRIDMTITYCSGVANLRKEAHDLASFPVPSRLDPHPVDGMAVLSGRAQAMRVALLLLSEKGQAMIARQGLVPVSGPPEPRT